MVGIALPNVSFHVDNVNEINENMFGEVPVIKGRNLKLEVAWRPLNAHRLRVEEEALIFDARWKLRVGGGKDSKETTRMTPSNSSVAAIIGSTTRTFIGLSEVKAILAFLFLRTTFLKLWVSEWSMDTNKKKLLEEEKIEEKKEEMVWVLPITWPRLADPHIKRVTLDNRTFNSRTWQNWRNPYHSFSSSVKSGWQVNLRD